MDTKTLILRVPSTLHTKLVREAGQRTMQAGKQVSMNRLMIEILEAHFATGKRPTRR